MDRITAPNRPTDEEERVILSIKRLDLTDAQTVIAGARAKAQDIDVPMCIAVTDEAGNLIAFERMDGTKIPSIAIAIDKGFTAAGIKRPTGDLGAASQPGMPAYGISSAVGGRMIPIAGGLPIVVDGQVAGAIGVSAGSPDQDTEVAQAGVQSFIDANP